MKTKGNEKVTDLKLERCHEGFSFWALVSGVVSWAQASRFSIQVLLGNAILDLYAKCGDVDSAEKAFHSLEKGDVFSWNSVISMYSKRGVGRIADCSIVLLKKVFDGSMHLDTVSWTLMVAGYVQVGLLEEALKVFESMLKVGHVPDHVAFVTIKNAFVGLGHAKKGYELEGLILTLMSSLIPNLEQGKQVHCLAIKSGLDKSLYAGSALIDMKANLLSYDEEFLGVSLRNTYAKILFKEFKNRESAVLWTALISGHTQNDCNEEVLHFVQEMHSYNVLPDQATFVSVLRACAVLSSLQEGRQIHALIYKIGYVLDELATSALVDIIHGDETRGRRATGKLIELELESENSFPYVLLSNIYALTGNWDEVNALRRRMSEKRVQKFPRCSRIVTDQEMNMFIAGDMSHPKADEIEDT
ncbi:hypothetical protein V6N13_054263 [Hibiscus sabdariffa]